MKKIIIIILIILLIPFFIITIKDIDREEVNPSLDLTLIETHNSIIDLNNHTLNEIFEDTSLIETYQLITNGNFSDGTIGWTTSNIATSSVSSGVVSFTATAANGRIFKITTNQVGDKIYAAARLKVNSSDVTLMAFDIGAQYSSIFHSGSGNYELLSVLGTVLNLTTDVLGINDARTSGWTEINVDFIYEFNISTLITNKQYSPLYQTTFDLMSDAQIKAQMDEFVSKPYLFLDYELLGLDDLLISTTDMDYWYNVYTTYSSYDYIQFGTAIAGDYLLLQQLIIDNDSKDFKLYRDNVIDEVHYTMTQNVDNITVSDIDGNELFILYSDDTYISRTSLSDITTLSFVGYNVTGYIDGDFDNTVLAFLWIIPILLVGGFFFIIFSHRKEE